MGWGVVGMEPRPGTGWSSPDYDTTVLVRRSAVYITQFSNNQNQTEIKIMGGGTSEEGGVWGQPQCLRRKMPRCSVVRCYAADVPQQRTTIQRYARVRGVRVWGGSVVKGTRGEEMARCA